MLCDFPVKCARLLPNKTEYGLLDELINEVWEERNSEVIYWNFVKKHQ